MSLVSEKRVWNHQFPRFSTHSLAHYLKAFVANVNSL